MSGHQVFHCCAHSPIEPDMPGPAFFSALVGETPPFEMVGAQVKDLNLRPNRSRCTAIHEAGHAAVHIALGNRVARVTIDGQPAVHFAGTFSQRLATIGTLAGDMASAWARSEIAQVPADELAARVAGIRDGRGGGCDRCTTVRRCISGTDYAPDPVVIATYRQLEMLAGCIVRMPPVWAAITDLADALMLRGMLGPRTTKSICRRHFEPGFLFNIIKFGDDNA